MPAILSTRAIKRKVRTVSNIKKITRAMQMVSAAKLKKVQVRPTELRFSQIKAMSKQLVDWFTSGEVDEVHLLFTRYVNAITFQPGDVQFLPIKPPAVKAGEKPKAAVEVEFEPEPAALLDQLTP